MLTGHLPDGAMASVISLAEGLVFPALYEGLGLPVLEAYQYDRPALVSDSSSLRELAPPPAAGQDDRGRCGPEGCEA